MDIGDFISDLAAGGSSGKGWRSPIAIICTLIGLGIGIYLGLQFGGIFKSAGLGILIGWAFGVFLRGFGVFLLIFMGVLAITFGFEYLQTWLS